MFRLCLECLVMFDNVWQLRRSILTIKFLLCKITLSLIFLKRPYFNFILFYIFSIKDKFIPCWKVVVINKLEQSFFFLQEIYVLVYIFWIPNRQIEQITWIAWSSPSISSSISSYVLWKDYHLHCWLIMILILILVIN